MGLFENLGRKVGQFTHEAKRAAAEEHSDVCGHCGAQVDPAQDTCPNCGEVITDRENASERDNSSAESEPTEDGQKNGAGETGAETSSETATADGDESPTTLVEEAESEGTAPAEESGSDSNADSDTDSA